ncbi:MAG: serine/threonine protein kinase [Fuerstiella sp.]|nr:serine/threonine protein kinase [Fuerstiella sp.]
MSLFDKKQKKQKPLERVDIRKRFNLMGRVGQGSMSKVWKAEDITSRRSVAIKVLDREKTRRFETRFEGLNKPTEGEIALSLFHPNIVRTHEIGMTTDDEVFLVMDYIDGSGLSLLLDLQGQLMKEYRLQFIIQIGDALSYIHRQGWIHRDLCPRNVLVTQENDVKLIDFGLFVPNKPVFHKPGNRTGTANYMAPELIQRRSTDQRLDVFSYAVTCFEMYTKRHPWQAAMTLDAVVQHINQPPLEITAAVPKIDGQIAEVIMKGLKRNPDDRWQTIDEMVTQFREAQARLVHVTRSVLARRKTGKSSKNGTVRIQGSK